MDELPKISSVPKVSPVGPSTPLRTLGERRPAAANDSAPEADAPQSDKRAEKSGAGRKRAAAEPPRKLTLKLSPSASHGALSLPPGAQGERYERQNLRADGGVPPYRFRVVPPLSALDDAASPPGIKLSEDGVLSGEPKRAGRFRFTVEAVDAKGEIGRAEYEIAVRLDLSRYKTGFDVTPAGDKLKRRRPATYFDPNELDVDGQPVYPLSLAEFLAYKSAQAYLRNDPLDPKHSLSREIKRAHPKGDLTHYAFFDSNRPLRRYSESAMAGRRTAPINKAPDHWAEFSGGEVDKLNEWREGLDAQAFGFVFEGRAFIICRGGTSARDWRVEVDNALTTDTPRPNSWWENVKFRTGFRGKKMSLTETEKQLIGGPDPEKWLKPARAVGFASAWAAIRDQIENWLTTLPNDAKREFVFSGHGLGGAMAQIGAQEFAEKRGRKIHAVVTFGAPCVGRSSQSAEDETSSGEHFVDNYATLQDGDLARRTLRVESEGDALPKLLLAKQFDHVGRPWRLEFEPLPSPFALFTRRYVTGPLLWLARGSFGYDDRSLSQLPRKALGYAAYLGLPLISSAVGGQAALKRYANYFSTLTYRKIREARLGDLDDEEALETLRAAADATQDPYYLCNVLYDRHLTRIYAAKPFRRFSPRYVRDGAEEARLAKRYYGPDVARYIF